MRRAEGEGMSCNRDRKGTKKGKESGREDGFISQVLMPESVFSVKIQSFFCHVIM